MLGFWDREMLFAKGRKTVGEKGETAAEGCWCPRVGQEDAQMLLGLVWTPKREAEELTLGKVV